MRTTLAIVAVTLVTPAVAQPAHWAYVNIPWGDADGMLMRGVNDLGQAVGVREWGSKSLGTFRSQPFLWDGTLRIDFENPADGTLEPAGITNDGTIYASFQGVDGSLRSGILSSVGFMELSYDNGLPDSSAVTFVHPDAGFIVNATRAGQSFSEFGRGDTVLRGFDSPGGAAFIVTGLNRAGQYAGFTRATGYADSYAHLGDGFQLLAGPTETEDRYATGINDTGEIVGSVWGSADPLDIQAVRWTDAGFEILPLPAPGHGFAYSMNNSGQIAGSVWIPGNEELTGAVIWDGDELFILDQHVAGLPQTFRLDSTAHVSDSGFLLVGAQVPFGEQGSRSVTVLLRPVPSPGTIAMLSAGLLLAKVRRRG